LLESAQDALASSPESALSLAERHATRFPHGSLAQEREVIAIEALLRLGRGDAARVRADRFYRAFPRSAHRARIENLLNADSSHNP
jgi:outer membrane protein assembly factor BamD (BamD/ComL family)